MKQRASERLAQLSLETPPQCTMFRVHKHLRDVNPKAYEPEVVSIGPYHHDKENLEMMEEHKLIIMHFVLKKKNEEFEQYVSAIKPLERKARECYAEDIHMNPEEFIEMLIIDGIFILVFVMNALPHLDPTLNMTWMWGSWLRDLILFENQIPFFILLDLLKMFEEYSPNDLMHRLFMHFKNSYPGKGCINNDARNPDEIKHLLDLVHGNLRPPSHSISMNSSRTQITSIDCARKLKEANVRFVKEDTNSLFDVKFNNGTLTMGPIMIFDVTESFFRNLVAYEQYFLRNETRFVTDYALLLDCLIDSSKDVEILCNAKVFRKYPGDDQEVVSMFNNLTSRIATSPRNLFMYDTIFCEIDSHCKLRRNKYVAALRHNYLNGPWAILSIVAALTVIGLTFIQTVCSILQVIPKNSNV